MTTPVALEDVSLRYGDTVAVDRVSLQVEPAEIVSILGPSGCGKTSLLRLVAGFESPLGGTIRIGEDIVASASTDVPPEKRRVGMLFQHAALFPHLDVEENVRFGVARGENDTRVKHALSVANLSGLEKRRPHELSGGQQQRVALARAIAARPRVMLLDEPFSSLDAQMKSSVRNEVMAILRAEQITTILVTHDQEEALSTSDRVAVMQEGRILQIDRPAELYRHPAAASVARFLGEGQLVDAIVAAGIATTSIGFRFRATVSDGPLVLLLRPEELQIDGANGIEARAKGTRFFGHDQIIDFEVGTATVAVRCDSCLPFHPGQRAKISLRTEQVLGYRGSESFELLPLRD